MELNRLFSGQLLKLLPESGYRYVALEVRGLSVGIKLAYAVDPQGKMYILGGVGGPLYVGEDASFFDNAKLAATMATSAFFAAKASFNIGVSNEEISSALNSGVVSAQISAHYGVGVNYDPISQTTEVTVGPGFAIPGATANISLGGYRVGSIYTNPLFVAAVTLDILKSIIKERFTSHCFIAGTKIEMADGRQKNIEEIKVGDMVASFDPNVDNGLGPTFPGKVTRTFRNVTRVLIQLHEMTVTPGHTMLSDNGEWMTVADILRKDRALVKNKDSKGEPFRARTGAFLGTAGDEKMHTTFIDRKTGKKRTAIIRCGIPFAIGERHPTERNVYEPISFGAALFTTGFLSLEAWNTTKKLCTSIDRPLTPISWPDGRTPFDLDPHGNWVVELDGTPFTPEWISNIPYDDEVTRAVMNAGGGPDDLLLITLNGPKTMRNVNGKNVFNDLLSARQMQAKIPRLVIKNPAFLDTVTNGNRAQRRKQSVLRRVH